MSSGMGLETRGASDLESQPSVFLRLEKKLRAETRIVAGL